MSPDVIIPILQLGEGRLNDSPEPRTWRALTWKTEPWRQGVDRLSWNHQGWAEGRDAGAPKLLLLRGPALWTPGPGFWVLPHDEPWSPQTPGQAYPPTLSPQGLSGAPRGWTCAPDQLSSRLVFGAMTMQDTKGS